MNAERRGCAIILNHVDFPGRELKTRIGTDKDKERLTKSLSLLGFDVEIHDDLTKGEIRQTLKEGIAENSFTYKVI